MEPFGDIDKFLNEFGMGAKDGFMPAVDIFEKNNSLIAELPIPNVDPDKVDVSIENDILTIKGKTEKKTEIEEKNYYRKEVKAGSFYRSVALPCSVIGNKAEAEYKNGILTITVPKAKDEKSQKIKIKSNKK